jgi:hypothetical protein
LLSVLKQVWIVILYCEVSSISLNGYIVSRVVMEKV